MHAIPCLTVFMHAFCHPHIENLLKGPDRCISEFWRLISDLLKVTEKSKSKGYLVTIDIKKAFDSLDCSFLITTLEKFGFRTNFIDSVKIFIKWPRIMCNKWRCHNTIYQTWKRCTRWWPGISLFVCIISRNAFYDCW